MANTLKIKRSAVASKVPATTDLQLGELAINTYDGKLFLKKDNGTESIIEVGTGGSMVYPGAGIPNSTGTAWGTSYSTTGSGTVVALATTPTFVTNITTPLAIGGTTASSSLTLQSTSGVGTSDSILFKVGNNGATLASTIDTSGNFLIGTITTPRTNIFTISGNAFTPIFQIEGTTTSASASITRNTAQTNTSGRLSFAKSATGTNGSNTAVSSGHYLGEIFFNGSDGTNFIAGAAVRGIVTGAVATNSVPSALAFFTNSGASAVATENMRIDSSGNVGIGNTPSGTYKLEVTGAGSFSTTLNVTTSITSPLYIGGTAAGSSLTLQSTSGVGTSDSILFKVGNNGATTAMTIGSAGNIGIGTAGVSQYTVQIQRAMTGGTTSIGVLNNGQIQSDVTSAADYFRTGATVASASFTVTNLRHFLALQGTIGASATVTNQYGFFSDVSLVGATNNYGFWAANTAAVTAGKTAYGFYSNVNTATGGGTTYGFYAAGTANNVMPNLSGGIAASSTLTLQSTTGAGTTDAIIFKTASQSERMRIDTSGNVGIGTASPQEKLTVSEGNFGVRKTSGLPIILASSVQASGYAPANIQLGRSGAGATATPDNSSIGELRFDGLDANNSYANFATIYATIGTNAAGGAPSSLSFATASSGAGAIERMKIDSSGNVGIGTSSPSTYGKLAVFGSVYYRFTTDRNIVFDNGGISGSNRISAVNDALNTNTDLTLQADNLIFSNAGTERFRITSSGNVGIGTASPAVDLEISSLTGSATPTPTEVRISTTSGGSDWSTTLPWGRLSFYSADGSAVGPKIHASIDAVSRDSTGGVSALVFSTSPSSGTLTERLRIGADGELGIGGANYGTSGQVLTSGGSGAAPSWATVSITPRVSSAASTTSPLAWNSDNFDQYAYTALANDLTLNADAGTPVDGRKISFRIQDNGTSRTITFTGGASKGFEPIGVSVGASGSNFTYVTTASKKTYFGCIYNAADARWDIVAISQEV